jgi:hypothetical protein
MKTLSLVSKTNVRVGLASLLIAGSIFTMSGSDAEIRSSNGNKAGQGQELILEVVNRHFTMGKKISSVYVRVFSDGTTECRTEEFTGEETDVIRKNVLGADDFEKLKAELNEPELLDVKKKYGLMYAVIDSWMEWDITVQHPGSVQRIQVASFSPEAARERKQRYPDALLKLGCSILKIRGDVYGDVSAHSKADCTDSPSIH